MQWTWQTIVMGVGFLVLLLTTRRISMRNPKLFWVSAAAPLSSVVLSTILVFSLRSKVPEIKTIRHLPKGLNPPSSNMLYFHGSHLALAIKTAVNYNAGAQTVVSNIVMAVIVLVTLLFLMPLFYYTPNLILATVILTVVIGLIDYEAAHKLWKVDKLYFLACLFSFLGVLFISVPIDWSFCFQDSVTCHEAKRLGNIPRTQIYQNVNRYTEAVRVPSFVIIAVEAPIYFANSTYLQERILRWIREEEEWLTSNNRGDLKCVILDMTTVTAIDTSGLDIINELRKILAKRSLKLVLANHVASVMEKLYEKISLEPAHDSACAKIL
ncbi:hypothetical protein ACS0TY_010392 [Phlomoides rotata]